jgi:hypothetical protein
MFIPKFQAIGIAVDCPSESPQSTSALQFTNRAACPKQKIPANALLHPPGFSFYKIG